MISVLLAITLIGVAVFVFFLKGGKEEETPGKKVELTAKELAAVMVPILDITTNLGDGSIIKISLSLQMSDAEAKEEITLRDVQVKDIIIRELADMKAEDFNGEQGKMTLKNTLKERMNPILQSGKVEKVYITSSIVT